MDLENPTWGQERIANELLLKLGLKVSPRTVRNTCQTTASEALANAVRRNAGRLLSAITCQGESGDSSGSGQG
jgi:hypothetical protein